MLVLLFGAVTTADLDGFLDDSGLGARSLTPLAGDLSQRRYFRIVLEDGGRLLAAHYPENLRPAMTRFAAARSLLADAGVRVPEIRRWSTGRGWMLVEDLGPETLFESRCPPERQTALYLAAVESAGRIAGLNAQEVERLGSPALDGLALRRELEPTVEFLLDPGGLAQLPGERRELLAALDELCARLGGGPLVPCHRDYMARNLVPVGDAVAVIDFQDLRLGPPAYDLASLLNDSFFPAPTLEEALLPQCWLAPEAREQYSRAVVQRALKAGGTFARFAARGNARHLPLVASTLARAVRHLEILPETAPVFAALRDWWTSKLARGVIC